MQMELPRRKLLQATGASLAVGGSLAATGGTASAEPVDTWEPAHSTNYGSSNRTAADINWIVVHVTVGEYSGAINWFQNPEANVSAHYVIRNSDGHTTKMVEESDIAYHASGFNANSIGIEHEWTEAQGHISETMYQQSAELIEYLADQYDIPLDYYRDYTVPCDAEGGIIEHRHAPVDSGCSSSNQTACPGPDWDGDQLMSFVDGDADDGPAFAEGQPITATTTVNTREEPGLNADVIETMEDGDVGTIVNGSETADGETWWGIHWTDEDIWGWSVEQYLDACPTFCHGTRVEVTRDLNVREGPSLDDSVVHTVPEEQTGRVVGGPQSDNGVQFWEVSYDSGVEGWSVGGDDALVPE